MSIQGGSARTACPQCGTAIDPLRTRFVRLARGGARVVAYCSAACESGVGAAVPALAPAPAAPPTLIEVPDAPLRITREDTPSLGFEVAAQRSAEPEPALLPVIADKLAAPTAAGPRSRLWRRAVVLATGAGLVSMALAIWSSMRPTRTTEAAADTAATAPVALPASVTPPAAPSPVARARALLREALSERAVAIRLQAASLLAPEGDVAARDVLAALAQTGLPFDQLQAAEALAASGDARGVPILQTALKSDRRDLRLEAARALARVGEPSGAQLLADTLGDRERGMGAAEALAALGDRRGVAMLETTLGHPQPEKRMRAALALGRTGHHRAEPVLRQILADGRYQNGAAIALAGLGATDAEPKLIDALRYSALRVEAAHALRKLGRPLDAAVLSALEVDLDTGDDIARLSAAEAILVLAAAPPNPEQR